MPEELSSAQGRRSADFPVGKAPTGKPSLHNGDMPVGKPAVRNADFPVGEASTGKPALRNGDMPVGKPALQSAVLPVGKPAVRNADFPVGTSALFARRASAGLLAWLRTAWCAWTCFKLGGRIRFQKYRVAPRLRTPPLPRRLIIGVP